MNKSKLKGIVRELSKEDVMELASEQLCNHIIDLGRVVKEISEREIGLNHTENSRFRSLFSEYKLKKRELQGYGVFESEYQQAFEIAVSDRKFDPSVFKV